MTKAEGKTRVCTDQIKTACANLSSMCVLSIENSRLAVQTVCKYLYKYKVYMNAADIIEEPRKRKCSSSDIESLYVLPSSCTILDYKQMQAS